MAFNNSLSILTDTMGIWCNTCIGDNILSLKKPSPHPTEDARVDVATIVLATVVAPSASADSLMAAELAARSNREDESCTMIFDEQRLWTDSWWDNDIV
jgi:hypothetical protein